ncbi:MAG: beta-lactamase family protein [Muribaculaceae bacterium]|nr:beta-lactamase family protein [Muribaculaceae bacterium]
MKKLKIFSVVIFASMFVAELFAQGLAINTKSGDQVSATYQTLDNIAPYIDSSNKAGVVMTLKDGAKTTVSSSELENVVPFAYDPETVEADLTQIMNTHKAVGLAVAAVYKGETIYSNAFGYRDRENKIAYKEDDLLRIASISKTFVATSIMQLVEQGKLSLDADVSTLMGFNVRNPYYSSTIVTVRMLLSHTSSLSDDNGYSTFDLINPSVSSSNSIRRCWNNYKPGSSYEYCNLGYNILGAIVEIVSGERFDVYVKKHILDPLGLNASYNVKDLDSSKFVKIYHYSNGSYTCSTEAYSYPSSQIANYKLGYSTPCFSPTGGLKISLKDLTTVMKMHMNKGEVNGVRILSEESCELMQTAYTPTEYTGSSYGFAMVITTGLVSGHKMTGHDGIAYGAYTAMYWDKEKDFGVVIMINGCDEKWASSSAEFIMLLTKTSTALYNHFVK